MIFAGSCQQENLEPVAKGNTVTYTVEAPMDVQTKAIGDGLNVTKVIYEVWHTSADGTTKLVGEDKDPKAVKLYQSSEEMVVIGEPGNQVNRAVITLDLLADQHYTILFWAQVDGIDVYNTTELTAVTYNNLNAEAYAANDERLAAFYAVDFINDGVARNSKVILTRPFAQVNLGTLNSKAEAKENDYKIDLKQSRMILDAVPTVFNTATDEVSGYQTMTFAFHNVPALTQGEETLTVNDTPYQYAGMNYVFAGANVSLEYDIKVSLNGSEEYATVNNTIPQVPVKRNYRTNIVGNLLTSKTEYEVVVDAEFNNPEIVLGDEWNQTGDYQYTVNAGASEGALAAVLAHADAEAKAAATKAAGPVVTIDLAENVVWETGAGHGSTPLLPADSPISAVVINGNGKTFTATGKGVGAIRLANGGLLTFNNVNIVDESVSYNEGAWEFTYLEFAGALEFNECVFNSGVQFQTEENEPVLNAVFNECDFISNEANVYAAWVCDGNVSFNECTFAGTRGLKVHEDYGSEVESVVVDGCTFSQLTKKPGIALGTLNAETSVTIKNSTFDRCQAGAQENYMYETDTDVTTFTFVVENNTVIPSGDGVVDNGNGTVAVASTIGLNEAIKEGYTTIMLAEGTYVIPNAAQGKTLSFVGTGDPEDTKIATNNETGSYEGCNYALDGSTVTFENISIYTPSTTYIGYARCKATYKNCVINGTYTLYDNSVFEGCTFNVSGDVYNVWTWGAPVATFTDCTFNSDGKAMLLYGQANTKLTIENSVFNDNGGLTDLKAAIEIGNDYNTSYELVVKNTVVNGYEINNKGTVTDSKVWANKNSMPTSKLSVKIDDLEWVGGCLYKDAQDNIIVYSAAGLTQAANYATEGTTNVIIANDIVGDATIAQKAGVKLVVNGQNKSYKGVIVVDGKSATYTTAGLAIKDLAFNAETISADACVRLGNGENATRYTCNVTVENCTFDVPGAVGVKSYTGGDKNLTIKGCTATSNAHSLVQAKGIDGILVEGCTVNSKNGMNFNNSTNVVVDACTANVRGYAARFGEGAAATGAAEVYTIQKSTLASACEDGDAVIILRGTADKATLTITNTTLTGSSLIQNNAEGAKVVIDGAEFVANGVGLDAEGHYVISNAAGMLWFANEVNVNKNSFSGKTVKLAADIDLAGIDWTPISQTGTAQFKGTFDGQIYTISNLTINTTDKGGSYASGLFGWILAATVKNVTVDQVDIQAQHYVGAIAGYLEWSGCTVENCHVSNATIVAQHNSASCGNKVGGVVGYAGNAETYVKNCTVANSTIVADRDAGQVVGAAKAANVVDCSASNVTVSAAEGCSDEDAGKNIRNEVIGRVL